MQKQLCVRARLSSPRKARSTEKVTRQLPAWILAQGQCGAAPAVESPHTPAQLGGASRGMFTHSQTPELATTGLHSETSALGQSSVKASYSSHDGPSYSSCIPKSRSHLHKDSRKPHECTHTAVQQPPAGRPHQRRSKTQNERKGRTQARHSLVFTSRSGRGPAAPAICS